MGLKNGVIPLVSIVENSIPEAYWSAIKAVHDLGYELRTEYDRRDHKGDYIDPLGKDCKVSIQINNPFAEPRHPPLSYVEKGKYIAEFLGAKDHLVVPTKDLLELIGEEGDFEPTQWPYCYHQRLVNHPKSDGSYVNQIDLVIKHLSESPITRRAIMTTRVPFIDSYIKQDMPCLGEIQLRAFENGEGKLVLNTHANWRSRDLYKAWGDNLIGLTNLLQFDIVPELSSRTGKEVLIGPYSEMNGSLHIYGQDYSEKGMNNFFEQFPTKESFVKRSMTGRDATELLIIPELKELKNEATWKFPKSSLDLIDRLIENYSSGKFVA